MRDSELSLRPARERLSTERRVETEPDEAHQRRHGNERRPDVERAQVQRQWKPHGIQREQRHRCACQNAKSHDNSRDEDGAENRGSPLWSGGGAHEQQKKNESKKRW